MGEENGKKSILSLEIIVMLITIVSAVATFYFWMDSRHAAKTDFVNLEHSFETKKLNDYIQQANVRKWQLEDRLMKTSNDVSAKEELRTLDAKLKNYEMEYQVLLENAPKDD